MGFKDLGPLGNRPANAAETYNKDGLAEKGFPVGPGPLMGALTADGVRDAAEPGKKKGHGVLRYRPVMDTVGIGENNGPFHHAGSKEFFPPVRQRMNPTHMGRCLKERLHILESPESNGIGVCHMGQGFLR